MGRGGENRLAPHPLTPAQLADLGAHRYPGVTREHATEACAAALATLGYNVTVREPATGIIKTAPRTIATTATGGRYSASVTDDGLAWTVAVEPSGSDVVVHVTPRGYRNGSEVHAENMWVAEVMNDKFKDLWTEVDSNLGARATVTGATVSATPAR